MIKARIRVTTKDTTKDITREMLGMVAAMAAGTTVEGMAAMGAAASRGMLATTRVPLKGEGIIIGS